MEHRQYDSVTLFLKGGEIRTTFADGKANLASRKPGDAVYEQKGADDKEEVVSPTPARLIVVELKNHPVPPLVNRSGYPDAFPRPGSKTALDNDRVVVWKYAYKRGARTAMHYHVKDAVVVFMYDGSIKSVTPDGASVINDNKAGDVKFNKGDRAHSEELVKGQEAVIVLELK
jgi:hypothetical protein